MTVRLRGVRRRFRGRDALAGVDLELGPGTITLVTGPNGAGKSTLLRCLAGILRHEGVIERERGPVGYLPQDGGLPPAATAAEILDLFGPTPDLPDGWLPFALDRRIGELSGGERRRVALAALFALAPRLLLLDEPLADLDGAASEALMARLAALRDGGAIAVIAAPDADVARISAVADRVIRLEAGRIAPARERAA